ncbi:MAG: hypothetical protein HYY66_02270, partial [Candidatus Tectomicrobia bacterium]|nr:hypothetical protein [Candidatus Tectomicrobia bacterium]
MKDDFRRMIERLVAEGERKRPRDKVERSPAAGAVDECLLKGGSLREASGVFRDVTGEKISLDSMSRHYYAIRARARRLRELELLAGKLAGGAGGGEVSSLAVRMTQAHALEAVAELDDYAFADLPPERLSQVVARLARADAQQESLRLRRENLEARARSRALGELEAALKRRPEVWAQVKEALAEGEGTDGAGDEHGSVGAGLKPAPTDGAVAPAPDDTERTDAAMENVGAAPRGRPGQAVRTDPDTDGHGSAGAGQAQGPAPTGSRQESPPALAAGQGPHDEEGLGPLGDRAGQGGVQGLAGEVLPAGEEAHEGPALLRDVVADGPAQHGVAGLERVEDRALGGPAPDLDLHLALHPREGAQVVREDDADHGSVWTSTEST